MPNGITSSAISFDSVLVDGQNLPLNPVSKIVDLTGYVGNGLRDLDLDGERDDILAGDSLIIKIYFNTPLNTFVGCEAYDIANNIQDQFLPVNNNVQFKPSYATYCKNEQLIFNDAGAERAFHFRISKHPSDFDYPITHLRDGETLPVTVTEWNSIGNFDRSKILVERTFVVPKGLYLVSSSDSWAGVGGGFYTVNTLPGVETDTIVFLTTRFPSGNKTTLSFDLILDCDSVAYECSRISTLTNPLHRTLQFTSRALVYDDLGNLCGSYDNMCRQGPGVSWNCDTIISDVEFVEFGAERATFGWTDTTMTTRVTRDSAGVVLNQAYNYTLL